MKIKSKEGYIQTTIMNLYFFLLSVGIGLYMYEYAALMPLGWAIFSYAIVVVWIGFNWFVLRPKIIKKNRGKTDDLISQMEKIKVELNEATGKEI